MVGSYVIFGLAVDYAFMWRDVRCGAMCLLHVCTPIRFFWGMMMFENKRTYINNQIYACLSQVFTSNQTHTIYIYVRFVLEGVHTI